MLSLPNHYFKVIWDQCSHFSLVSPGLFQSESDGAGRPGRKWFVAKMFTEDLLVDLWSML